MLLVMLYFIIIYRFFGILFVYILYFHYTHHASSIGHNAFRYIIFGRFLACCRESPSACNNNEFKILCFISHVIYLLIPQVVVFFSTCDAVDFHYSLLSEFHFSAYPQTEDGVRQVFLGCKTLRLHGNMEQEDRTTSFQAFKTEKSALLLSTDVSARGLDFPKVRCIIQYDSPGEATEYVHRYLLFLFFFGRAAYVPLNKHARTSFMGCMAYNFF